MPSFLYLTADVQSVCSIRKLNVNAHHTLNTLFYRDRLSQITRLIDFTSTQTGNFIGHQL